VALFIFPWCNFFMKQTFQILLCPSSHCISSLISNKGNKHSDHYRCWCTVTLQLNKQNLLTKTSSELKQQLLLMKLTHSELCRSEHVKNTFNWLISAGTTFV
jgi:hypothetical protein